jgi:ribonuclease HI
LAGFLLLAKIVTKPPHFNERMSKNKPKYYVVWVGAKPGIYLTWEDCKKQIHGYPQAKYKSFESRPAAEAAFKAGTPTYSQSNSGVKKTTSPKPGTSAGIIKQSLSVDAACSGNPGDMEYRGVDTASGKEYFKVGPLKDGTNNIGEFLAIVHALALLKNKNLPNYPIYTDSKTAIGWVQKGKCNTKLDHTGRNEEIFELILRAESWLVQNKVTNPIHKWETKYWGEIPADFGRK